MSGAFLYAAIVAIWAFVLVPGWLRRQHAQPQLEVDVEVDVEFAAEYDAEPYANDDHDDARPGVPDTYAPDADQQAPSRHGGPLRRSRVLRARRRLLTMLVLLTVVAAACTVLKLTSWWACVPPAVMLGMYLLLLREAALADAEQARRRAATEVRVQAARQRAHAAQLEQDAQPSAQIIDISARVGDQLYDQYADATVRAVGD